MDREKFIKTVCLLETFRLHFKNCHWFLRRKANKHKTLDELIEIIDEYTDSFAEEGIVLFGDIGLHDITISNIIYDSPENLFIKLTKFCVSIKTKLEYEENKNLSGLISITDDFIHRVNQTLYRFGMD